MVEDKASNDQSNPNMKIQELEEEFIDVPDNISIVSEDKTIDVYTHIESDTEEKMQKDNLHDEASCIIEAGLEDVGYIGNPFTCCNNRGAPTTMWKRLDRMLFNIEWFDRFGSISVSHLVRACSDHLPLLIQSNNNTEAFVKYFRFLNLWTNHDHFMNEVRDAWTRDYQGNPTWNLHQKLKNTSLRLSKWPRELLEISLVKQRN